MIIEIFFYCILGILIGLLSGMTPGLHLNLVSIIAVSVLPAIGLPIVFVFVLVMSIALTHTIADALASTYLGVPDEQTIAGLLPAQQMVRDGRAHESLFYTIVGSVLSVFACIVCMGCIVWFLPAVESLLAPVLGFLLLFVLSFLVWREEHRVLCICLCILAGCFGVLVLSQTTLAQPLLPLLGGLFGGAGLVETLRKKITIPTQKSISLQQNVISLPFTAVFLSTLTGILAAFLPGLGSSQAAILAGRLFGDRPLQFQLVLAGGINTVNMAFSIATWVMLAKSRNGAVAALSGLGEPTIVIAILLLLVCLVVAPLAGVSVLVLSRRISGVLCRINYTYLATCILCFVVFLVCWFDGLLGFAVFVGASSLGSFCHILGLPRHYLMGCLLVPVIVFFLQ